MNEFEVGKTYWLLKNGVCLKHTRWVTVHARILIDGINHAVISYNKHGIKHIVVRPIEIEDDNEVIFVGKHTRCIAEFKDVTQK